MPTLKPPSSALPLGRHEQQWPTTNVACRNGDERGIADRRYQFAPKHLTLGPGALSVNADHRGQYPQGDR